MKRVSRILSLTCAMVMCITVCLGSAVAQEAPASYKYQVIDYYIPGRETINVLVMVNSEETKFEISYEMVGVKSTAVGTIEDGIYTATEMSDIMMDAFDPIVALITDDWKDVPANDGSTHTVTYDSNYEKQADTYLDVGGSTPIPTNALKRFGYNFDGWYLDKECIQPIALAPFATEDVTVYAGWAEWDAKTAELMGLYKQTMKESEYLMTREPAFEQTSFDAFYQFAFTTFLAVEAGGLVFTSEESAGLLFGLIAAKNALVQVADPADFSWFIWEEGNMATEDGADQLEFFGYVDDEDFRPFLVPYMLADQSSVKGNIILVSGGAFFLRANTEEAYPSARAFNELGYNVFVLQRRVLPYSAQDSGLDLQRAIRYLKYHAEELGIAKIENLAAGGYSGGGGTVSFYVLDFYGDTQPNDTYPSYIPDEIDAINSDVDAILMVYSAVARIEDGATKIGVDPKDIEITNPNWPATFIVAGTDDTSVSPEKSVSMYTIFAKLNKQTEMHLFANAPHGFGAGTGVEGYMGQEKFLLGYTGAGQWIPLADTFLQQVFGITPATY